MRDFRGPGFVSVSARIQNWLDEDGSVTGFGVRSAIASAVDNGMWWRPDSETVSVAEGPVNFFKLASGPERRPWTCSVSNLTTPNMQKSDHQYAPTVG
jgi:hypothetical protein